MSVHAHARLHPIALTIRSKCVQIENFVGNHPIVVQMLDHMKNRCKQFVYFSEQNHIIYLNIVKEPARRRSKWCLVNSHSERENFDSVFDILNCSASKLWQINAI